MFGEFRSISQNQKWVRLYISACTSSVSLISSVIVFVSFFFTICIPPISLYFVSTKVIGAERLELQIVGSSCREWYHAVILLFFFFFVANFVFGQYFEPIISFRYFLSSGPGLRLSF